METATAATAQEGAEMEIAVARIIEQIKELREQMKADDQEIARIRAENATLKAETRMLRDETRAILATLPLSGPAA